MKELRDRCAFEIVISIGGGAFIRPRRAIFYFSYYGRAGRDQAAPAGGLADVRLAIHDPAECAVTRLRGPS